MTDEELLATLDIGSACERAATGDYCDAHDSSWDEPPLCDYAHGLAQGARIGMEIAKAAIAEELRALGEAVAASVKIAKEWQP